MNLFEEYAKGQGVNLTTLDTCEDQAPWLYEKLGYKKIFTQKYAI